MYYRTEAIKNIPIRGGLCILSEGARRGRFMANQSTPGELASQTAVASYVASLSAELSTLARRSGLETLVYLFEMVRLEAENTKTEIGGKVR